MKKRLTSAKGERAYEIINPDTGEVVSRVAEFNHMSLNPAIGKRWLEKFFSDVYPEGKVVVNGVKVNAPRYYDKEYRDVDLDGADFLAFQRGVEAANQFADNTPERLGVKEQVARARLSRLKRSLE